MRLHSWGWKGDLEIIKSCLIYDCHYKEKLWIEEIILHFTHSAQLTTTNEDAAFIQHTGIEVQHVVDINCHKVLRQISLGRERIIFDSFYKVNFYKNLKKKCPSQKKNKNKPTTFHPPIMLHPVYGLTEASTMPPYVRVLSNCSTLPLTFGELGPGIIKLMMFHIQLLNI